MDLLDKTSLFQTVDNVLEALLFGLKINQEEKSKITDFIVHQHGKPHVYANTFAPTEFDLNQDLILFTGEKIKSNAGKCHTIGEEASRILRKLDLKSEKIKLILQQADKGLFDQINKCYLNSRYDYGLFCCKACSDALWLNIASGGLNNNITFLAFGLKLLKNYREKNGTWKGFPYYYTLYVLNEIETDLAIGELKFTAKTIEKRLNRKQSSDNKYNLRRKYIFEQILEKVNSN